MFDPQLLGQLTAITITVNGATLTDLNNIIETQTNLRFRIWYYYIQRIF